MSTMAPFRYSDRDSYRAIGVTRHARRPSLFGANRGRIARINLVMMESFQRGFGERCVRPACVATGASKDHFAVMASAGFVQQRF